jgi:hypothetical protein
MTRQTRTNKMHNIGSVALYITLYQIEESFGSPGG